MLRDIAAAIAASDSSFALQERTWIVPAFQSVHILAIALLVFATFSLNAATVRGRGSPLTVPWTAAAFAWTWGSLAVLLASGAILIWTEPVRSLLNLFFRIKMVLVLAVAALTFALQRMSIDRDGVSRARARLAIAGTSTLLWIAIIFCGRLIAYFGNLGR